MSGSLMPQQDTFIIDKKGNKTGVILSIEDFNEFLEDLYDLLIIAERLDEPSISIDELKNRLKKDGIL
jgi:PHD/YefM family antitoxin component YafN of YafNO toxin-antitoxin module